MISYITIMVLLIVIWMLLELIGALLNAADADDRDEPTVRDQADNS